MPLLKNAGNTYQDLSNHLYVLLYIKGWYRCCGALVSWWQVRPGA